MSYIQGLRKAVLVGRIRSSRTTKNSERDNNQLPLARINTLELDQRPQDSKPPAFATTSARRTSMIQILTLNSCAMVIC
jgi:hypothetical protein